MSGRESVVKSTSGVKSNPFAGLDTRREALQAALANRPGSRVSDLLADARAIEAFLAGGESK